LDEGIRRRATIDAALRLWLAASVWLFCAGFAFAQNSPRFIHVFVALADNAHQGIVPVPAALGNGDDPGRNLYWGAAFGVRTFFRRSSEWKEILVQKNPSAYVLERSVFVHGASGTYLVADAYRGQEIRHAIEDFFRAAAGQDAGIGEIRSVSGSSKSVMLAEQPELVVYVGHDGLMDFSLDKVFPGTGSKKRSAMVLACASKAYFAGGLQPAGAEPVLWTTNLMAPEAYTLKAAVDGWIAGETGAQIRQRAAEAYAKYQKIAVAAALRLFATGW
jgi:hypothetical protein